MKPRCLCHSNFQQCIKIAEFLGSFLFLYILLNVCPYVIDTNSLVWFLANFSFTDLWQTVEVRILAGIVDTGENTRDERKPVSMFVVSHQQKVRPLLPPHPPGTTG